MQTNVFIDDVLVNIIFRLDGTDRQNFSRTCKQLRVLIVGEHIRLIRNEAKRLLNIFGDIDAPMSKSFKQDGLKLLNNQSQEVDSQFTILCCLIRLMRYYHVVQICICFMKDMSTNHCENVFVSIAFSIFQSLENYKKGDDSKFICFVLSNLLPDFRMERVSTHKEMIKLLNHVHPSIKERSLNKLAIYKNDFISFIPLISEVLSIKLPFHNNKTITDQLSKFGGTYRFCHNEFINFSQDEIRKHVNFYKEYHFSGSFSIILPLQMIDSILLNFANRGVETQFTIVYPLLIEWFRLNCSIFYTLSEFSLKTINLLKNSKKTTVSLNWPLTMLNHQRTGLINWFYTGVCFHYLFNALIYFIPPKQIITLMDHFDFLHLKSDEQTAKKLALLSHDERESIIGFLNKPLISQFLNVYTITPQIMINILLGNLCSEQQLLKVLVNSHITNFIFMSTNFTKTESLTLMMKLPIGCIDELHSVLIDFYLKKVSETDTLTLMWKIVENYLSTD